MPEQAFSFTMDAAASTYAFLQTVAEQLRAPHAGFAVAVHPDAKDNHGKHWRGWRATITGSGGQTLYIHTGLVYHPDTRRGLYLEIDRKNNLPIYAAVWDRIGASAAYDLCKDEPDYLKLFYPDAKLDTLMGAASSDAQARLWRAYFEACVTALLAAAGAACAAASSEPASSESSARPFAFRTTDLDGLYRFSQTFDAAIAAVRSGTLECQRDFASPDCFAPRFNGYRVYARNPACGRNMYLWCGLLYDPASRMGLMIEMDAFSNQDVYADALERIAASPAYDIVKNEKHIKLFMPDRQWAALCALPSVDAQQAFLADYAAECMEAFSRAVAR